LVVTLPVVNVCTTVVPVAPCTTVVQTLTTGNVTTNSAVLTFVGENGDGTTTVAGTNFAVLAGQRNLYVRASRLASGFVGAGNIASTSTGYGAGTMLNTIAVAVPAVGSDMATVVNTFNGYSAAELATAIPKLAPQTSQATAGAAMNASSGGASVVSTRMASIRGESTVLADGTTGVSSGDVRGRSVWGRAFGTQNTQGTLGGFSGYKSNTVGMVIGSDMDIGGDRTVGLALTYASTKVDQTDAATGNNSRITSVGQTIYGTQNFGQAYVDGMLGLSYHSSDNVRLTALSRTATSSTSALEYSGRIGSGYRFALKDKLTVTPNVQYTMGQYSQKAYTEAGANSLNLAVNSLSVNRSKLGVGVRVADERTTSTGLVFRPEFNIMASRDLNDAAADVTAAFTGGGSTFTTTGQKLSRNSLDVGTGVVFLQGKTGQVGLNYNLQKRESFTGHSFLVQGRLAF